MISGYDINIFELQFALGLIVSDGADFVLIPDITNKICS